MTTDPKHGILQDKSGRDKRKQQEKAMFAGAWSGAVSQPVITDRALGSSPTPMIFVRFCRPSERTDGSTHKRFRVD
jgi:hypothetical protein